MPAATSLITGTDFVAIPTRDAEAAREFYANVLGLPERKQWGQMPAYEFETGNLTLAVMQSEAFGMEFKTGGHLIALQVDDVPAAQAELESRGVEFKGGLIDSGVCHQIFFEDPDGNTIGLHHRYAPGG
jgi:catechol 2,3-dioxygenase-like lactoylglutathione lyase family enzyme